MSNTRVSQPSSVYTVDDAAAGLDFSSAPSLPLAVAISGGGTLDFVDDRGGVTAGAVLAEGRPYPWTISRVTGCTGSGQVQFFFNLSALRKLYAFDAADIVTLNGEVSSLQSAGGSVFRWTYGATTDPAAGVFGTWAEVYGAASQVVTPSSIFVSVEAIGRVPAKPGGGAWDMEGISVLGGGDGISSGIIFEDGAKMENLCYVNGVVMSSVSSEPVLTYSGTEGIVLDNGSSLRTDDPASAPFLLIESTAFNLIYLRYFSTAFSWNASAPAISIQASGGAYIATDLAVTVFSNSLAGGGDFFVADLMCYAEANRNPAISHTQNGITGSITYTYGS